VQSFGCTHSEKIDGELAVLLPTLFLHFHRMWPCSPLVVNKRRTAESCAPQRVGPVLDVCGQETGNNVIVNYEKMLLKVCEHESSWTRECMSVTAEQHSEHEA